jgi:hypothetical protein
MSCFPGLVVLTWASAFVCSAPAIVQGRSSKFNDPRMSVLRYSSAQPCYNFQSLARGGARPSSPTHYSVHGLNLSFSNIFRRCRPEIGPRFQPKTPRPIPVNNVHGSAAAARGRNHQCLSRIGSKTVQKRRSVIEARDGARTDVTTLSRE